MHDSPAEDRFHRLIEIGRGVLAELDLEVVLGNVVEAARELTGARYAALGVLDERKESLDRFIHVGIDDDAVRVIGELPRGRGVLGELILHPEPLRLPDVSLHPHSYGFPAGHPPMRSFLGVPIAIRGEAYGNLYITEKAGAAEFTEADEEAMIILAGWAAIAVENARLYTDLADRQEQLQRALRQVETTLAITRAVGGETQLDRILELIVKRARALVEAQALAVFLLEGDELAVAASVGPSEGDLDGLRQPLEGTSVGAVVRTQEATTLSGEPPDDLRTTVGAEVALLVPLVFRGECRRRTCGLRPVDRTGLRRRRTCACCSRLRPAPRPPSPPRRRSRPRASGSGSTPRERERHHWAHELHDEALQQLAAIRLELAGALRDAGEGTESDSLQRAAAAHRRPPRAGDQQPLAPDQRAPARCRSRRSG